MPSAEPAFTAAEAAWLLAVARAAIAAGPAGRAPLAGPTADCPPTLRVPAAAFVTLHLGGELRGCMGSLRARRPLVEEVAATARSAAFSDPRFAPVGPDEVDRLQIHVSVLSPPEPIDAAGDADLVARLRPGVDGLLLEDGPHVGTLLPSVWESLPDPIEFVRTLKRKAGLRPDYWSPSLRISRYTTVAIR